ncbi:MAG: ABC transporter transmembrane domain-containing protein [Pseudomonadota bacterium]
MVRKAENGADDLEREKSKRVSALTELWPFMRPYKGLMVAAMLALLVTAGVSLILPLTVGLLIDTFLEGDTALLDQYFVVAIVFAGLLALGTGLRYALVSRIGERVVADVRKAVFARVISMSPSFYENILTGEVLSRITTDTTLILSVIGSSVSVALRNALLLMGGLILMLITSPKLTAMVLLIVPLVLVPILGMGRKLRRLSLENQDWIAHSSGKASEALTSVQTVQAFTNEADSQHQFNTVTEQSYRSAQQRILTRATLTVIVIFLVFTCIVGVLWIGARDVRAEIISMGTLVQFLIYSIMVAGAVAALSEIWSELQRAAGATERLVEMLHAQDRVRDPEQPLPLPRPVRGEVRFENVHFNYPARPQTPALDGVNLTVKAGENIAIVGPSGAGKSTIIQLLQRFYDPDAGQILLDGLPIRELTRADLRGAMAMVPQEPVVFAESAMENIRFGRLNATDIEVEEAARAAAAHDFIAALPDGYDTQLGERGVMLSGGQRQRIALARAILRDAPVLLLDEATSALDAESERAVQDAVEALSKTRTTIIVAHRLATVKRADRIVVMDGGRIAAFGTHASLVAEDGLYARLARLQFTDGKAA